VVVVDVTSTHFMALKVTGAWKRRPVLHVQTSVSFVGGITGLSVYYNKVHLQIIEFLRLFLSQQPCWN